MTRTRIIDEGLGSGLVDGSSSEYCSENLGFSDVVHGACEDIPVHDYHVCEFSRLDAAFDSFLECVVSAFDGVELDGLLSGDALFGAHLDVVHLGSPGDGCPEAREWRVGCYGGVGSRGYHDVVVDPGSVGFEPL